MTDRSNRRRGLAMRRSNGCNSARRALNIPARFVEYHQESGAEQLSRSGSGQTLPASASLLFFCFSGRRFALRSGEWCSWAGLQAKLVYYSATHIPELLDKAIAPGNTFANA